MTASPAMNSSENMLVRTLRSLPKTFYLLSPGHSGGYVTEYVSEQVTDLLEENAGLMHESDGWFKLVHPDDLPGALQEFADWEQSSELKLVRQYRLRSATGHWQWVSDESFKVTGVGLAHKQYIVGLLHDITAQIQQQTALERFTTVAPGAFYEYQVDTAGAHHFPFASEQFTALFGVTPGQAYDDAEYVFAAIHPADRQELSRSIADAYQQQRDWQHEFRVGQGSQQRWLRAEAMHRDCVYGAEAWYGIVMDITAQKQTEAELRSAYEHLDQVQRIARLGHWEANLTTGNIYWSDIVFEIFGVPLTDHRTTSLERFYDYVHPDDRSLLRASEQEARSSGRQDIEYRVIRPDGRTIWVHETADYRVNDEGEEILLGIVRDITEKKELELKLQEQSDKDDLTGLFNRRYLLSAGRQMRARAIRHGQSMSLIMLDMDRFKALNDNFGHATGDQVLITVARLMCQNVRTTDVAARIGGEELVILLEGANLDQALVVAERLRHDIAQQEMTVDDSSLTVNFTASFGVAATRAGKEPLESLLGRADRAMYQAKSNGRNRVEASCRESATVHCTEEHTQGEQPASANDWHRPQREA